MILFHGLGGECDDGGVVRELGFDELESLFAVHEGHLDVEEDEVRGVGGEEVQGFLA